MTDLLPIEDAGRPILSAIVVNYRSYEDVLRLALELSSQGDDRFELLVVDNHSLRPGQGQQLESLPKVRLIRRPSNDGFAAAVNDGLCFAGGRWVLLLNPDVIAGPEFVRGLLHRIAHFESGPRRPPAVIGFALRNPDGTSQPSVGRFPSLAGCFREALLPRNRRKYQPEWRIVPGAVSWVTGACMLLRCDFLARHGGLDADFFLYHEEVDLCRRAWNLGESVEFDPSVSVVHLRPLQNRAVPPWLRVITRHSKLLYFRKHLPRWQFEGLARIVQWESVVREGLARLRGTRDEQRAWRAVRQLPAAVRRPNFLRGTAVRELAERAVAGPSIGLDRRRASE